MSTIRETVSTSRPGAGTSRSGGIVISFVTAITVFAVGQVIVSHVRGSANLAPEAVLSPEPPPAAPAVALAAPPAPVPAPAEAPAPAAVPSASSQTDPPHAAAAAPNTEAPVPSAAPTPGVTAPPTMPATAAAEALGTKTEHPPLAAAPTTPSPRVAPPSGSAAPAEDPAPATSPTASAADPVAKTKVKAKTSNPPVVAAALPAAGAPITVAAEPRAEAEAPPAERDRPPAAGERQKAAAAPTLAATGPEKPSDKDVAREAWRRNLPDISAPEETRASILIPIKGSIEGATYHINTKPKSVIVNLPKAESLITMRFYKIKREGFGNLWIKQEEGEGTTLKLMLNEATTPQVEIKDEYIRINVRKPTDLAPKD